MLQNPFGIDPIRLFGDYMKVTGVPQLADATSPDPALAGKKLGLVNGSAWITLWCNYFGKAILPGVKLVNVGNEGVQLNFMRAHHAGEPCPPPVNIELSSNYAKDLVDLVHVDAVMITCSTMNRAYTQVSARMKGLGVPTVQIDEAMMEEAVSTGGRILVVATHGPTVKSTQNLLQETAERMGRKVDFAGATVEEAFECLGQGRIAEHNQIIADAIRKAMAARHVDIVVLAQLSMAVFAFSHPDPVADLGVKVLNSAETGFRRAGEILRQLR